MADMIPTFMAKAPTFVASDMTWSGEGWHLSVRRQLATDTWKAELKIGEMSLTFTSLRDVSVDDLLKDITFKLEDLCDALFDMGIEPCV